MDGAEELFGDTGVPAVVVLAPVAALRRTGGTVEVPPSVLRVSKNILDFRWRGVLEGTVVGLRAVVAVISIVLPSLSWDAKIPGRPETSIMASNSFLANVIFGGSTAIPWTRYWIFRSGTPSGVLGKIQAESFVTVIRIVVTFGPAKWR